MNRGLKIRDTLAPQQAEHSQDPNPSEQIADPVPFLRGQSLVVVAILLVLLIGMLAFSIDGGNWYWQRRNAQNAADAGALAGARQYCTTPGSAATKATAAIAGASEYAEDRNRADWANINVSSGVVSVTANITFTNFFAGVLGFPDGQVSANASAACCPPTGGTGVLPIAWSCRPPVMGGAGNADCAIQYGDGVDPDPIYVIMDDKKASPSSDVSVGDFYCQQPPNSGTPAGALDCDLDPPPPSPGDGINEILAGGDRSWLDLDGGGGGASSLSNWIQSGFPGTLNFPVWTAGQSGVANSVFNTVENYKQGQVVLVPVFDRYCGNGRPDLGNCPGEWNHALPDGSPSPGDSLVPTGGTMTMYFRLVSFSLFHITCVDNGGGDNCPGHNRVVTTLNLPNSLKTIEGYFVTGFDPDITSTNCTGIDVGVYSLNLTR